MLFFVRLGRMLYILRIIYRIIHTCTYILYCVISTLLLCSSFWENELCMNVELQQKVKVVHGLSSLRFESENQIFFVCYPALSLLGSVSHFFVRIPSLVGRKHRKEPRETGEGAQVITKRFRSNH